MADTKRKVLKLHRLTGDGQVNTEPIILVLKDPATGEELKNDDGSPAAFLRLRALDEAARRAIVAKHTRLEKDPNGGRGLFEFTDITAANEEILDQGIEGWEGIVGADEKPLVCTSVTKAAIDAYIKTQARQKLFGAEVVEVLAASFR